MARKTGSGRSRSDSRPLRGEGRCHGYAVKPQWQAGVKAELERRRGAGESPSTEKELALAVGCAQSTMHDLLNKPAKHSSLVPRVHDVFGWPPPPDPSAPVEPSPPLPSPDALEMAAMYDQLPDDVRRDLRQQAATILKLIGKLPG